MKIKYVIAIVALFTLTTTVAFLRNQSVTQVSVDEREQIVEQVMDTLTEWQLFMLALIEVESEYDSGAISSEGARGIFQEMPIYIRDVNRIIGTEWMSTDAHNDTIALDCFTVIQRTYNPEQSIERAIYLHNPTAGPWYKRRIMEKMADIKRREQVRTLIITY